MGSGKAPAFQFYAAEYLADENVQLLTLEQEGIYVRLLAYCWREGSIPADLAKLSRLCKNAPLEALAGVVELFIPAGAEGRMVSQRLEDERRKHEEYRQAQAANGARGGRPPKHKPDESDEKGLGLFGESQTKAKKRSSSAFASSFSTSTEDKGKEQSTPAVTAIAFPAPMPFCTVPLNDGSEFPISESKIAEWIPLYRSVDVRQQVLAYKAWAINKPTKRKTRRGILGSINSWLADKHDKAGHQRGENTYGNRAQNRTDDNVARARGAFEALTSGARSAS